MSKREIRIPIKALVYKEYIIVALEDATVDAHSGCFNKKDWTLNDVVRIEEISIFLRKELEA